MEIFEKDRNARKERLKYQIIQRKERPTNNQEEENQQQKTKARGSTFNCQPKSKHEHDHKV